MLAGDNWAFLNGRVFDAGKLEIGDESTESIIVLCLGKEDVAGADIAVKNSRITKGLVRWMAVRDSGNWQRMSTHL